MLLRVVGTTGSRSTEAVRRASGLCSFHLQVPAGYVEHRVHVELALVFPNVIKSEALGVSDEPGGLVIQRGRALFQGAHTKSHCNSATLRTQAPTGGSDAAA